MFWFIPAVLGLGLVGGGAYLLTHEKAPSTPNVPPKGTITPERDIIFQTAMDSVTAPENLKTLAASFASQDLPAQAAALLAKANSILAGTSHPNTTPIDLGRPAPTTDLSASQQTANQVQQIADQAAQVAAAALAAAQSNGFTPDPTATDILNHAVSTVTPLTILRIQQIFNKFPQPGIPKLQEDGQPGPSTNAAIAKFQANKGFSEPAASLSAKGNVASVGPLTALAINSLTNPELLDVQAAARTTFDDAGNIIP